MAKKENEKMENEKMTEPKALDLKITKLTPTQSVLNLETNEEEKIVVSSVRYELPKYDSVVHGSPEEFLNSAMAAAQLLVNPVEKQVDALLYRATQDSYQSGKLAALSAGKYLTQDLRTNIVQIMRGNNAYADMSASDCFVKWKSGYKEQKPGAIKVLTMAQDMGSVEEF